MPSSSSSMPFWQRFVAGLGNAVMPGRPFNTRQSSLGNAWRAGDYAQFGNDPYARARVLLGVVPGVGGALGEQAATWAQNRAIDRYEHSPEFVGAPQDYDSSRADVPREQIAQTSDSSGEDSRDAWNNRFDVQRFNLGGMNSYMPSFSSGGGMGYGWQGTSDIGGTLANLAFFNGLGDTRVSSNPLAGGDPTYWRRRRRENM